METGIVGGWWIYGKDGKTRGPEAGLRETSFPSWWSLLKNFTGKDVTVEENVATVSLGVQDEDKFSAPLTYVCANL